MDESAPDEFDHYTTALLFGGPTRVVQVAVLLLHQQRLVRISKGTRRIEAVRREQDDDLGPEDDPVRAAVLGAIPGAGRPLGQLITEVAASPQVRAVGDAMRETGLVRGGLLRSRPTRRGRKLRRTLAEAPGPSQAARLAVLGPAGVEERRFREILEADDPKPIRLPHGARVRTRHGGGSGPFLGWKQADDDAEGGGFDAGDAGGSDGGGF